MELIWFSMGCIYWDERTKIIYACEKKKHLHYLHFPHYPHFQRSKVQKMQKVQRCLRIFRELPSCTPCTFAHFQNAKMSKMPMGNVSYGNESINQTVQECKECMGQ